MLVQASSLQWFAVDPRTVCAPDDIIVVVDVNGNNGLLYWVKDIPHWTRHGDQSDMVAWARWPIKEMPI